MNILRQRIFSGEKPAALPQGAWEKTVVHLQNENKWEDAVFEATQNTNAVYFPIDDHIRLQIKFWRDRRNDCAHFKLNEINEHHLQAFWAFMQSNLAKITLEGGRVSLLNKFARFFDPKFTPAGKSVQGLIAEIPNAVKVEEFAQFINDVSAIIDQHAFFLDPEKERFYTSLIKLSNPVYSARAIDYAKADDTKLISLIAFEPSILQYLNLSSEEVRSLWKEKLSNHLDNLTVYAALLREHLIPNEEISEANEALYETAKYPPEGILNSELVQHGFYQIISEKFFDNNLIDQWLPSNLKKNLIVEFLINYPVTPIIAKRISDVFSQQNHPFELAAVLIKLFEKNLPKKAELKKVLAQQNLPVPRYLPNLHT